MLKILQENKKFQSLGWVRNRIWVLERCRRRFFGWKNAFLVLERCRRRLFWWKNYVCFLSIMQLLPSIMQLFSDE